MMAPTTTNYAAIQEDEIEALRSIYMDDFVEEAQAGAWNKKGDRAFRIKLRPSGDEDERGLTLIVSLPPTYPKTEPRLRLEYGLNIRQKSRAEAQDILKKRPSALIDSVMIFDIASALQDVLGESPLNVPTLEEERAAREQSARVLAMEAEQNRKEKELEAQREEEIFLRELVKQRASRHEKRENKSLDASSMVGVGGDLPGVLTFERVSCSIKDPNGGTITINSVNSRVKYRQGPVCDVFTVQPFRHIEGEDIREDMPFLALKECIVWPFDGDEPTMRRAIQNFESKMEFHTALKPHQSIMKPLNFCIQRQIDRPGSGWVISILMELGRRQSLREALDIADKLDVKLIRAWSIRIIEGLQHYHRHGSAHGNIHSGNILLEKGETETGDHRKITVAKLSDGGFQRDLHSLKRGKAPENWPIAWTAPEKISKTSGTDAIPATDIWDFGLCFLQMAFGLDVLSDHQSPSTFLEEVALTKSLRALLRQVFNNDARKRPSAWDLLHFEFFRNDDALLEPVRLLGDSSAFGVSSLNLVDSQRFHPRRDSHTAGSSSRYSKEFVEEGRLGRGGFGEVFRARNKVDGQPYAIKKIKARSKPALDPVLSEVTVLSRLNHPNVVRYFASWIEDSMVQELSESEFSEDEDSFSVTKSGRRPVLPASSRGLDFISSNNVNIVFGNDPNEEGIDGDYSSSDSGDDEDADQALDGFEEPAEQNSNNLEEHSPNNERTLRANQEQTTWTVLYIQMEYCKPEVRISPFRTTPDAQKQHNAIQFEGTAIVLMQDHDLSPEQLPSCSSNLS